MGCSRRERRLLRAGPFFHPRIVMRQLVLTVLATVVPFVAQAQRRVARTQSDSLLAAESIPRAIRRDVEQRWSGPAEIRSSEAVTIAAGTVIPGSVAVQNGPLLISGRVTGNVTAVNSDVTLLAGARIDG